MLLLPERPFSTRSLGLAGSIRPRSGPQGRFGDRPLPDGPIIPPIPAAARRQAGPEWPHVDPDSPGCFRPTHRPSPDTTQHGCSRIVEMQRHCSAWRHWLAPHSLRVSLSTLLAAHKVSPRAAQALRPHTDPRLTASVYTDEKLLPLAAELVSVPAITASQQAVGTGKQR